MEKLILLNLFIIEGWNKTQLCSGNSIIPVGKVEKSFASTGELLMKLFLYKDIKMCLYVLQWRKIIE